MMIKIIKYIIRANPPYGTGKIDYFEYYNMFDAEKDYKDLLKWGYTEVSLIKQEITETHILP